MLAGGENSAKQIGLTVFFEILAWFFVGLRVWARWLRNQKLQLNDYLLFGAIVGSLCQCILITTISAHGTDDVPAKQQTLQEEEFSKKLQIPGSIFWGVPLFFVKLSILHFYTVVFKVNKWLRAISYVMMVIVSIWFVVYVCVVCLGCIPMQKIWDASVPGACLNTYARVISPTCINLVFDVIIVVLPMPVIWKLSMSVTRRFLIFLIFSGAICVCVVSGIRLYWFVQTTSGIKVGYFVLTNIEIDLSVIVACLPLLQPIASKLTARFDWFNLHSHGTSERTGSDAADAVLHESEKAKHDPTASERLRSHLWHIPEMESSIGVSTTRDELENTIQARDSLAIVHERSSRP